MDELAALQESARQIALPLPLAILFDVGPGGRFQAVLN
jgi:hypothetical protein